MYNANTIRGLQNQLDKCAGVLLREGVLVPRLSATKTDGL